MIKTQIVKSDIDDSHKRSSIKIYFSVSTTPRVGKISAGKISLSRVSVSTVLAGDRWKAGENRENKGLPLRWSCSHLSLVGIVLYCVVGWILTRADSNCLIEVERSQSRPGLT